MFPLHDGNLQVACPHGPELISEHAQLDLVDQYVQRWVGTKTTRYASEVRYSCPPVSHVVAAEKAMRDLINRPFGQASDWAPLSVEPFEQTAARYWERALRVGPQHGANPSYNLADYFTVETGRSYPQLARIVKEQCDHESVAGSLIRTIEATRVQLEIPGPHAARLIFSTLQKCLEVEDTAENDTTSTNAHRLAVQLEWRNFIETDLARLAQSGNLTRQPTAARSAPRRPLEVAPEEVEHLIKISRLQDRPYSEAELFRAEAIFAFPELRHAVLVTHNALVQRLERYIRAHPHMSQHTAEPFSEIAIPCGNGQFLPNPKLIRAIGHNIIPAIGRVAIESDNGGKVTVDDIRSGIKIARRQIFRSYLFIFRQRGDGSVGVNGVMRNICPAGQMFPDVLLFLLPAASKCVSI